MNVVSMVVSRKTWFLNIRKVVSGESKRNHFKMSMLLLKNQMIYKHKVCELGTKEMSGHGWEMVLIRHC